jgi:hypothetical protein
MIDKFLKFDSQEQAEEVLFDKTEEGYLIPKGDFVADVVGVIYKPTGKTFKTAEGPVPEMAPIPGWHVNVRGSDADKFPDYEIEVATPTQFWA